MLKKADAQERKKKATACFCSLLQALPSSSSACLSSRGNAGQRKIAFGSDCIPMYASRSMWYLYISFTIKVLSEAMALPIIPFFMTEEMNGTVENLGYAVSIFAFAQMCSSLFFGRLSDSIGRRKVLLFAYMCNCIGFLLLVVSLYFSSLFILYVARFIAGVAGASITMIQAMIADVCTLEQRVQHNGYLGAVLAIGFVLGPALGGLMKYFVRERILCFHACCLLSLTTFIVALSGVSETLEKAKRRRSFFFFFFSAEPSLKSSSKCLNHSLTADFINSAGANACAPSVGHRSCYGRYATQLLQDKSANNHISHNYHSHQAFVQQNSSHTHDHLEGSASEPHTEDPLCFYPSVNIVKYNYGVSYIGLLCLCILRFLTSFAATVMGGTYFLLLRDTYIFEYPDSKLSLILTLSGICMVLYQGYVFKKMVKLLGYYGTMYLGCVLQSFGIFFSYYSTNYSLRVHTLVFCFVYTFAYSLIEPSMPTIAAFYADQLHQGLVHGFISSSRFLATILGPALYGNLYKINSSFPFSLSALLSALSIFAVFLSQMLGDALPLPALTQRFYSNIHSHQHFQNCLSKKHLLRSDCIQKS